MSHPGGARAGETRLYWNRQGAVNCEKHAPYRYSDTWANEGWERVIPHRTFPPKVAATIRCEVCRATAGINLPSEAQPTPTPMNAAPDRAGKD